jgi:hypothetical protein
LLRGVDGKDILPDDEAIFANQFITDGDTRGAKKFIARQVELIGNAAEGIAEHPSYDEKLKSKRRKGLLSEAQLIDLFDI